MKNHYEYLMNHEDILAQGPVVKEVTGALNSRLQRAS